MTVHPTPTELIDRVAAGDRSALENLLLHHYDRLNGRIRRKMPAFLNSVVSSEDIVQLAMIDAFRSVDQFQARGSGSFYRWLARIADNRMLDTVKAQKAAKRGSNRRVGNVVSPAAAYESMDCLIHVLAQTDRTPSQSAARHEAERAVRVGLSSLKDENRRALDLRYIQGLPVADVARILGRSPHAIHNVCHRALQELRTIMGRTSRFFSRH